MRPAEERGHLGRHLPRLGVEGLAPAEDEVGAFLRQRQRKRARGAERVRQGEDAIGEVDRPVRSEREALAQCLLGLWRAHRHRDHLAADLLPDRDGMLDRVAAEDVQLERHALALQRLRLRVELDRREVRDLLDQADDLHWCDPSVRARGALRHPREPARARSSAGRRGAGRGRPLAPRRRLRNSQPVAERDARAPAGATERRLDPRKRRALARRAACRPARGDGGLRHLPRPGAGGRCEMALRPADPGRARRDSLRARVAALGRRQLRAGAAGRRGTPPRRRPRPDGRLRPQPPAVSAARPGEHRPRQPGQRRDAARRRRTSGVGHAGSTTSSSGASSTTSSAQPPATAPSAAGSSPS